MSDTGITLEWKAFEPTINNAFQNLYTDESLTDVTLASEGNKQVLAHKVVISSCSSFFKNIIGMNKNSHPLIYLQGVSYDDIVLLKRFMYLGKASVAEENVNRFVTLSKIFLNKSPREIKEERVSSANLDVWYKHFPPGITDSISNSENLEIDQINSVENVYACTHCSFKAVKKLDLKIHLRSNHKESKSNRCETVSCIHCSFKAASKFDLKIHLRTKHKETKLSSAEAISCIHCLFKATNKFNLKTHMRTEHTDSKLSCNHCDIKFNSEAAYRNHKIRKHTDPDKVKLLVCEHCSYSTKLDCSFSLHKKKHNGKMIHCDQCDYQTVANKHLIAHKESQHENNEYKCETCEYIGKTNRALKFHINRDHRGIRYFCASCDYIATKTSNLRSHERTIHLKGIYLV